MKFNEFIIGQKFKTKSLKLTKENIIEFASEYDPQFMHIDEEKASKGRFGGIIASGLHTLNITCKLWVEEGEYGDDIIAGVGINNIKFTHPVFPGDEIFTIAQVTKKEAKKNNTGILTVLLSTYNQNEEKVFQAELLTLMKD